MYDVTLPDHPAAYRIETERLVLRCWRLSDARTLRAELDASNQHLRPHIPWMVDEPRPLRDTMERLRASRAEFDRDQNYRYAVFARTEPADVTDLPLVGEVVLLRRVGKDALEVGYWVTRSRDGQGYGTEMAAAAIHAAFEVLEVERMELHCSPDNPASIAIATKLGFTHDATLRRRHRNTEGEIEDTMVWSLFGDEFLDSLAARTPIRAWDGLGEQLV